MSAHFNRRSLLAALPAALAVGAVPVVGEAISNSETPIMAIYREWTAAETALCEADDEDCDDLGTVFSEIERRALIEPARNQQDVIMKLIIATSGGEFVTTGESRDVWSEVRALIA